MCVGCGLSILPDMLSSSLLGNVHFFHEGEEAELCLCWGKASQQVQASELLSSRGAMFCSSVPSQHTFIQPPCNERWQFLVNECGGFFLPLNSCFQEHQRISYTSEMRCGWDAEPEVCFVLERQRWQFVCGSSLCSRAVSLKLLQALPASSVLQLWL